MQSKVAEESYWGALSSGSEKASEYQDCNITVIFKAFNEINFII